MNKIMLIDAVHPEETRVALVSDGRVDDFDFEAAGKRQLRGNIYLAKVTRVEPSLQAAFVDYGGNRHGFLAFSEIHPDYYQLPQEDREALLREEAERAAAEAAEDDEDDVDIVDDDDDNDEDDEVEASEEGDEADAEEEPSEADEAAEEIRPRKRRRNSPARRYKIQEVIRRRQVMLVQVVKEERGNKGAALTTYLSLAGRYCVLMPNTPSGGGISRKIANGADRKRLKKVMGELDVPEGMGLIVRTAGAKRTKAEIKRDFDYLLKLWDKIRELTLKSMAPCLVNEEGGLVHRAMRDLYDKDVGQVLIQGDAAYREAKDLAKLLMPSHAKNVKHWKDASPLFVEHKVEEQLEAIFSPVVQLKSGGYLVINQTEALVAIDVNSGKSTRERNIEQTALRTNLEAAEEACRQMRLRDLAGLVVIDFIDMDENKNNRAVEKKLKDCLKLDRARVQHGRISQFGLMEISRQRRRAGVLESSSSPCESCNGTGRRRSIASAALQLLRAIEARAAGGGLKALRVEAPGEVAIYMLNNKRDEFTAIETEAGVSISITSSDEMLAGDFKIDVEKDPSARRRRKSAPVIEGDPDDEALSAAAAAEDAAMSGDEVIEESSDAEDEETEGRSRRRRRRRGGRGRNRDSADALEVIDTDEEGESADGESPSADSDEDSEEGGRRRRRRGRRGGRRRRRGEEGLPADLAEAAAEATAAALALPEISSKPASGKDAAAEDGSAYLDGLSVVVSEILDEGLDAIAEPKPAKAEDGEEGTPSGGRRRSRGRRRRGGGDKAAAPTETVAVEETAEAEPVAEVVAEPAPSVEPAPEPEVVEAPAPEPTPDPVPEPVAAEPAPKAEPETPDKPKRRGWWSRRKAG